MSDAYTPENRARSLITELEHLYGTKLLNGKAAIPLELIYDTCECLRLLLPGPSPTSEPPHRSR